MRKMLPFESGGNEMKSIVSSFSMSIVQASALQEATRRVKNRSAWINEAIARRIKGQDAFDIMDIPTIQLIMCLRERPEINEFQRATLLALYDEIRQ